MIESVANILEQDELYFDYFKNALNFGTNYFECEFVHGNSAVATLFYVKKSHCINAKEALVRLTIPFRYYQGCFRQSESNNLESIFNIVKEDMRLDIYWGTEFKDVKIERLLNDLKIFQRDHKNKVKHFKLIGLNSFIESKYEILGFLEEFENSKTIKLTEWNPSFEYFIETENYFFLYNFSTGA